MICQLSFSVFLETELDCTHCIDTCCLCLREKELQKALVKAATRALQKQIDAGPPDDLDLEWEKLVESQRAMGYGSDTEGAPAEQGLPERPEFPPPSLGLHPAFPHYGDKVLGLCDLHYADCCHLNSPEPVQTCGVTDISSWSCSTGCYPVPQCLGLCNQFSARTLYCLLYCHLCIAIDYICALALVLWHLLWHHNVAFCV